MRVCLFLCVLLSVSGFASTQTLPRAYRGLSLGMDLDSLTATLSEDAMFVFRERDVSFLPLREETLVESSGTSFIRRAYFQLREGTVFIMSFSLNTQLVDHFSVFSSFVEKYGGPASLDPGEAVWESAETRISIERPLTVKYVDKTIFDAILGEESARGTEKTRLYEEFLDDF
ncbi:hypothetical protein FACS1894172_07100 [Spirochaetia bacterium]|nr:hypothetical protein FACS1894164_08800 [Spirochaetia bacterium]GHU31723.1 hypothetical protein FACS1894172_07100 [Spirochaetia bacterium]